MNNFRFIIKSLSHFKKQHIAVFLATLISTAVLTGALIIGDSVSYSLKNLVDKRLGKIEYTMLTGDRFVRSQLAAEISADLNTSAASLLMMPGMAINTNNQKRINQAQILGIDDAFWQLSDIEKPHLAEGEVLISLKTAERLNLQKGEEILLRIRNADLVPLQAPFAIDEDPSIALRIKVKDIVSDEQLGRFSLRNNQLAPYNIFISRDYLAQKLDLENSSNLIIIAGNDNINEDKLNKSLKENWLLKDAGLQLNNLDNGGFELISDRIFIDHSISKRITETKLEKEKFLTYFVNSLRFGERETPYSFVSAVSEKFLGEPLLDKDIIINSWLAEDLNVKVGDSLRMEYFVIGHRKALQEKAETFRVYKIIPVNDKDKSLMPSFPGLSDAGNCSDWVAGIPIDLKKIRDKDELYWTNYRGTPKAFISLEKGLEIWDNQFGNYTSIRFPENNISKADLEKEVISILIPKELGLVFQNVRSQGVRAASSGVDFGELFLSLSFFVIAAAILLSILIYSLNLESRMQETGVLYALGFTKKQIIKLRFSESFLSIILSAIAGGFAGILYNKLMINGLNSVWNDAIHADALEIYIKPSTLIIGVIIGIIISLLSIYIVTARKLKNTIVSIIREQSDSFKIKKSNLHKMIGILSLIASIALVLTSIYSSVEKNSSLMLIAGFLFLVACIYLISVLLNANSIAKKQSFKIMSFGKLAMINAGRNKSRSIAVIALLAIGTFTVVITGSNRKTFTGTENQRQSGTGGYKLWVENTVPILQDLNTQQGKAHYGLENEEILNSVSFVQFNSLSGDDASCLNLNQVQRPRILGVDGDLFDSLQAFSFAKLLYETDNPWLELNKKYGENIIPVIADQTVIQWGLMKAVGDTLHYINEYGKEIHLLLVGGLNGSIFQGSIMIFDNEFIKNFPGSSGSRVMLVDGPKEQIAAVDELLSNDLSDYGIEISSASDRLAAFYSVTNTYLSIFMILGGLGVILGTLGLGIVLMRNMLDRKQELDILTAVGFSKSQISRLVFTENLFLLSSGIIIGFFSAAIGILPSILSPAFNIPGNFLFFLVFIIFFSGLIWIYLPIRFLLKK